MSPKSFQDLPQEVIAHIIDYLDSSNAAVLARACSAIQPVAEGRIYKCVDVRPTFDMDKAEVKYSDLYEIASRCSRRIRGTFFRQLVYDKETPALIDGVLYALIANPSRIRHVKLLRAHHFQTPPHSRDIVDLIRLVEKNLFELDIKFGTDTFRPHGKATLDFWKRMNTGSPLGNLRTLSVELGDLDELQEFLCVAPNIERVELKASQLAFSSENDPLVLRRFDGATNECIAARIASCIARWPELSRLRVLRCTKVTTKFMIAIAAIADHAPVLEALSVDLNIISPPETIHLAAAQTLRQKSTLKYFEIAGDPPVPLVEDGTELLELGFESLKMGARMDKQLCALLESNPRLIHLSFDYPRSIEFAYDESWIDRNEDALNFCTSDVVVRTIWEAHTSATEGPMLHAELFRYSPIQSRQLPSSLPDVHGAIDTREFLALAPPISRYQSETRPYDFISSRQLASKTVSPSIPDEVKQVTAATAPTFFGFVEEWCATGEVDGDEQTIQLMWEELEEIRLGGLGMVFAYSVEGSDAESSEKAEVQDGGEMSGAGN